MPRMNGVNVLLVPRLTFKVVLGVVFATSVMVSAPWRLSCSPEYALTATGTLSSSSLRRRAVTTIDWSLPVAACAWVCASFEVGALVPAAGAGAGGLAGRWPE